MSMAERGHRSTAVVHGQTKRHDRHDQNAFTNLWPPISRLVTNQASSGAHVQACAHAEDG
jgi:hypothetical protein